jgi:RND family efflux transporter MFP subunit
VAKGTPRVWLAVGIAEGPDGRMRAFSMRFGDATERSGTKSVFLAAAMTAFLGGCKPAVEEAAPAVRPVRTVTVERRAVASPTTFTGRIEAEDNVALAFRISGRVLENRVKLGEHVSPGQVVARLEPQNELNALRSAQANLAAGEAQLVRARNHFERQELLLARAVVSRTVFDEAKQERQTAQSQVDAASAQLKIAKDSVSFTELVADAPGIVTAVGPGAGEVVQNGEMIVRLARQGGRDAVFDVPAQLIRSAPADPQVIVSLTDDPKIEARGRIREVAPQADPVTRTFEVKTGLTDPPAAMRLGATVTGRMQTDSVPTIEVPSTALAEQNGRRIVWIVDSAKLTVSARDIELLSNDPISAVVSKGLDPGDVVVTSGVRSLHPGQKIRLLGSEPL